MKQKLLFISSLFIFCFTAAFGQDSVKVKIPVKGGLQLYVDYGKILMGITDFETKYEAGIAIQLKYRFQPNFQAGIATLEPSSAIENGAYKAQGQYWKAGLNYLLPFDANHHFYAGVKYGQSTFDDEGTYKIESNVWPDLEGEFKRSGFEASWYELVLGSEKLIANGQIRIGGMFGVRFIAEKPKEDFIDIYAIPGYGRTLDKTVPYLNVYIKYHLNL